VAGEHRPLTRRTTFRLGGAVALLAAAGLTGRAVLARPDVDEYHAENERYFTAVNENPSNYHRNPTVEDAVRESDVVIVGEIVEVKQLGVTVGESPDLVSPAYGYVVRVADVVHGSLPTGDRERLTVHVHDEMIGQLRATALQLATTPQGLATWILRSNREAAEAQARLQDGVGEQILEWFRWYAPTYTPAGAVQGVLMQGRRHVQSPLDDDPKTRLSADAARYRKLSELNAAIAKMG
jgi:hypothetical protein